MKRKAELLAALRAEFDRWEVLLGGMIEEDIVARRLPSGLSIKDTVAHLHAWQQFSIAQLEAAIKGGELDFHMGPPGLQGDAEDNLEQINAWIHEIYLDRPWVEVHEQWRAGLLRFLDLAAQISESHLQEVGRHPWLDGLPLAAVLEGSLEHHHEEHYEPLVKFLIR